MTEGHISLFFYCLARVVRGLSARMRSTSACRAARDVVASSPWLCSPCRLEARQASTLARAGGRVRLPARACPAALLPQQRLLSRSSPSRLADTTTNTTNTTTTTPASPPPTTPQQTTTTTFYDLFPSTLPSGPPPAGRFAVDTRALRAEFLRLQARAHPDVHPAGAARTRAAAASAHLNEAYRTLASPLLRAQYLLALRGVDVAADEALKVDEPALLALVLEAREEIEGARAEADLESPRRENEERIVAAEDALEVAFREDDVPAAKRLAVRMRYWVNVRESLDEWEVGKPVVLQH